VPGLRFARVPLLLRRRHAVHFDQLQSEAGDPLHEPGNSWFGAKGCRAGAYGDLAVAEFRTKRDVRSASTSAILSTPGRRRAHVVQQCGYLCHLWQ
jgi:hypothetical protein